MLFDVREAAYGRKLPGGWTQQACLFMSACHPVYCNYDETGFGKR